MAETAPATRVPFDPLGDLFVAQVARPDDLGAVNLRAISPYERALLVIDGTVTKFIEAYMMEPVVVERLSQRACRLDDAHQWLDLAAGSSVIAREVLLLGAESGRVYAYAVSLIVPDRLPPGLEDDLAKTAGGLGRVILELKTESRREVLWYGRQRLDPLPDALVGRAGPEFLTRTYRIISGGLPSMLINERFPSGGTNDLPSHH